mgnify:CR=1 FL=1
MLSDAYRYPVRMNLTPATEEGADSHATLSLYFDYVQGHCHLPLDESKYLEILHRVKNDHQVRTLRSREYPFLPASEVVKHHQEAHPVSPPKGSVFYGGLWIVHGLYCGSEYSVDVPSFVFLRYTEGAGVELASTNYRLFSNFIPKLYSNGSFVPVRKDGRPL